MNRKRRSTRQLSESSSEDENLPLKRSPKHSKRETDSSSESDIENYLKKADEIDLNHSFFTTQKTSEQNTALNNNHFPESSSDEEETERVEATHVNFHQLDEYSKKLEETRRHVEAYNKAQLLKKRDAEDKLSISSILANEASTSKAGGNNHQELSKEKLNSDDFETLSDDDSDEDLNSWEEVKDTATDDPASSLQGIPKDGLQITVNDMPDSVRTKKKKRDIFDAIKRRLNRVRKENQILVHKVHLLCWIAHGNHLNSVLNNSKILSLALGMLPSENSYPKERTDLSYLESLLKWFKKTLVLSKSSSKKLAANWELDLEEEIKSKKEVSSEAMLVLIFVALIRSLGIQCRLVVSFQVEPLRPPSSELCSLKNEKKIDPKKVGTSKAPTEIKQGSVEKVKDSATSKISSKTKEGEDRITVVGATKQAKAQNGGNESETGKSMSKNSQKGSNLGSKVGKKLNLGGKSKGATSKESKPSKAEDTSKVLKNVESHSKNSQNQKSGPSASLPKNEETLKSSTRRSTRASIKSNVQKNEQNDPKEQTRTGSDLIRIDYDKNSQAKNVRAKSSSSEPTKKMEASKSRSKSTTSATNQKKNSNQIKIKLPETQTKRELRKRRNDIAQIDGGYDSDDAEEYIVDQLDGGNDSDSTAPKKKLRKKEDTNTGKNKIMKNDETKTKKEMKNVKDVKVEDEEQKKGTSDARRLRKSNVRKYKDTTSEDSDFEHSPTKSEYFKRETSKYFKQKKGDDVRDVIVKLVKDRIKEQNQIDSSKLTKEAQRARQKTQQHDYDSDFVPEEMAKRPLTKEEEKENKKHVKMRLRRKVISSDEEGGQNGQKAKQGVDLWAEVFLETEEKWISVDVVRGQLHCVLEIFKRATQPVSYVLAWDNHNSIKDITARYCQNFNTVTRKLRIDAKWWTESLQPFKGPQNARDKEEDEELERQQLDKPLPTSIAEYKNHPLYVLRRHLLKFEGIYPADVPPLGFVRKEEVYPRQCVYVLHSRDIWLKHAKVVKIGEEPYKIVKARPKYDRLSNTMITDQMLEIFGPWQTEDYVPPTAENGVVPRNAFGNVELFKECMLPKNTVHLRLPGLNKVAKKMNIDCAPAVVGFDFHSGWSHPTFDGFVVCEEYAEALTLAWDVEQEELERKEEEKIEKRVYGNWKRLIRGLLIRERLNIKYNCQIGNTEKGENDKKKEKTGSKKVAFSIKKK